MKTVPHQGTVDNVISGTVHFSNIGGEIDRLNGCIYTSGCGVFMGLKSTSFFLPATLDTPLLKYEESCLPCKLNGIINLFQGNHHQSNLVNHELRKRFSYHAVWYSLQ